MARREPRRWAEPGVLHGDLWEEQCPRLWELCLRWGIPGRLLLSGSAGLWKAQLYSGAAVHLSALPTPSVLGTGHPQALGCWPLPTLCSHSFSEGRLVEQGLPYLALASEPFHHLTPTKPLLRVCPIRKEGQNVALEGSRTWVNSG